MADLDTETIDVNALYNTRYFREGEYADYLRDRSLFAKLFQDRLRVVREFKKGGDLIEIGCAYGFFLAVASQYYRTIGFDIAQEPVRYAREKLGVDARCEDFASAFVQPESADVVTMWDTIEHLLRPDTTIKKAAFALRPSGLLFVTTGDIDSVLARMQREKWRIVRPPMHLHYFNRRTIATLLKKAGLRVVDTRYVGVRASVRQILYSLLVRGRCRPSRTYALLAASALADFSFVLNTYEVLLVVGQKSPV